MPVCPFGITTIKSTKKEMVNSIRLDHGGASGGHPFASEKVIPTNYSRVESKFVVIFSYDQPF